MVVATTLGWIGPVSPLGWQRPPPLPAAPIKGADPRRDTHTQPGTCAHGTATTHSSACSEGQNQMPSAAPAALLPWLNWHSGHSVTLLPPVHPCTAPREDKKAF